MKKRKRLDRKKEIKLIYAKITFKANQKSNSQFEIFSFFMKFCGIGIHRSKIS